jgi:hypothetical protein
MEALIANHTKALEHAQEVSAQMMHHKTVYYENSDVLGPRYWELYTKFREAEAAYTAAREAVDLAEKALNDAEEAEYYKNLKCTFCGDLDSVCGGDHGDEMREICREGRW